MEKSITFIAEDTYSDLFWDEEGAGMSLNLKMSQYKQPFFLAVEGYCTFCSLFISFYLVSSFHL